MMALDVVAILERAMDDAIMTNFAGLYYPVTGSVTADAAQTLRKGIVAYRDQRARCGVAVRCTGQASRRVLGVLAVKGKILTIDLPRELRTILNSLFELLHRLPF